MCFTGVIFLKSFKSCWANIEELRKKRFQYLNLLYGKTGGDKFNLVNMWDLGNELGFSKEETKTITQYLKGEGLMEYATIGGGIGITHYGVKEVEDARSHPEQPTHYFPPVNIINIHHMEGSQIQQGTISSTQTGSFLIKNKNDIVEFVKLLKEKLPEFNLNSEDKSAIKADIATLESQVASSRPKPGILKECLTSIQRVLEGAGGTIISQQLLPYILQLLAVFK